MLGLGLLMAWWYARRRAVASGTDPSHIDLMVPLIFLISILGAWLLPILSPGDTLGRFVIEFVRADSGMILGNLTFTQLLCAMLFTSCTFAFGKVKTVSGSPYGV